MTDKQTQAHAAESNMEKDPKDWVTGDEPMRTAVLLENAQRRGA